VDTSGCAYVAGKAWSTNFPMANAFQPTNKLSSGYSFTLSKVAADGASLARIIHEASYGEDIREKLVVENEAGRWRGANGC